MRDRLVANERSSAKVVSIPDKHTHVIVWAANLDVLGPEIRLEPRPEPVVC